MSKLSKALTATKHERVADFNYATFDETWDPMNPPTDSYRYTITAKMGATIVVNEGLAVETGGAALTEAVRSAKRALVEEMFGEFRQPLIEINIAAMHRDYETVKRLSNQLLDNMFDNR